MIFFTIFALLLKKESGSLAERRGTGLQNRLQQFESARNLKKSADFLKNQNFFYFIIIPLNILPELIPNLRAEKNS